MTQQSPKKSLGPLMLDIDGLRLSEADRDLLSSPRVGGLILFARNYASPAQLEELVAEIRECNPGILIAVDQEGGRVQRFRKGFTRLPPMFRFHALWKQDRRRAVELAAETGWLMAAELIASGIDFSFAPVLDLETGVSQVIGDRAFGVEPIGVSELATAFIEGMHEAGMAATGKHFPGHGNVAADSHTDIPVDSRTLSEIRDQDLLPFKSCAPMLDAVMPAHVIYEQGDSHCAGFSRFWLDTVLKQELGFQGAIFSDDLSMAGAGAAGTIEQRVDAALQAGCDMILVCNDRYSALAALRHLESSSSAEENPRLLQMQRRMNYSRAELQGSAKWQRISAVVEALAVAEQS